MKSGGVIIFSGFNPRAVIALCRTLEKHQVRFYIIALHAEDDIFRTSYRSQVQAIREKSVLDYADIVRCLQSVNPEGESMLLAPTSEALNRFLLSHRDSLNEMNVTLPLVDETDYLQVSDKSTFASMCTRNGLTVPELLEPTGVQSLPVVAKPHHGQTIDGKSLYPLLIHDEVQWQAFLNHSEKDLYYIERFITGESYYLMYYVYRDGRILQHSQRNLVQQPDGKSIVAAEASNLHKTEISDSFKSLFQAVGFHGLIMVEVIKEEGLFYVIEANPRMWGPSQLQIDSGCNVIQALLHDYGYLAEAPCEQIRLKEPYFWWEGFWEPLLEQKELKWYCSHDYFWSRYDRFFKADVFNRDDSRELFVHRAKHLLAKKEN